MTTVYLPYYHAHADSWEIPYQVLGVFSSLALAKEQAEKHFIRPEDDCFIQALDLNALPAHRSKGIFGGEGICCWNGQTWNHSHREPT